MTLLLIIYKYFICNRLMLRMTKILIIYKKINRNLKLIIKKTGKINSRLLLFFCFTLRVGVPVGFNCQIHLRFFLCPAHRQDNRTASGNHSKRIMHNVPPFFCGFNCLFLFFGHCVLSEAPCVLFLCFGHAVLLSAIFANAVDNSSVSCSFGNNKRNSASDLYFITVQVSHDDNVLVARLIFLGR